MPKKFALAALALCVTVGLVVGITSWSSAQNKSVSLSIDGKERSISTSSDTVDEVLESEDIELSGRDIVTPSVDSEISDGTAIAVSYARQLTLTVDGQERTYWTTSTTVNDALADLDQRFAAAADFSTSRSAAIGRGGLEVEIATPKSITLKVGADKAKKVVTTGLTVEEALVDLGVEADKDDEIKPGANAKVDDGSRIVVTRVAVIKKSDKKVVGYETIERAASRMYEDQSRVGREGENGLDRVTYRIVKENGEVVKRRAVERVNVEAPVARIEYYGTKERPEPEPEPAPEPSSSGSNYATGSTVWDQLAQCESGGNWAINSGNGYYGGLQFSGDTWLAYGGGSYAGTANLASREQQIAIAEKVLAAAGWGSWPACSASLGLY